MDINTLPDYLQEYLTNEIKWENNASAKIIHPLKKNDQFVIVDDISEFPEIDVSKNEFFLLTLEHPITRKVEIAYCFKVEKNQHKLYIKRGYENTEIMNFPPGSLCENRITKGTLELLYLKYLFNVGGNGGSGLPNFYPNFIGSPGQFLRVSDDGSQIDYFTLSFVYTYYLNKINNENDLDNLKDEFFIRHNLKTKDILYNLYDLNLKQYNDLNETDYLNLENKNQLTSIMPETFSILNNNTIYIKCNPKIINGVLKLTVNSMDKHNEVENIIFYNIDKKRNLFDIYFKNNGNDIGGIKLKNIKFLHDNENVFYEYSFDSPYLLLEPYEIKKITFDNSYLNYDKIIFEDFSEKSIEVNLND